MKAVARALEGLEDRAARRRVMDWARTRYVDVVFLPVEDFDTEGFGRFVDALRQAANQLGNIAPIEIIRFGEYVREMKAREEEAA